MVGRVVVDRDELCRVLEAVGRAVVKKGTEEQSDCFLFVGDGTVFGWGGDLVLCGKIPVEGFDFRGAVPAVGLLSLVRSWPSKEIAIENRDGQLVFMGEGIETKLVYDREIRIPLGSFVSMREGSFVSVGEDFSKALFGVLDCVRKESGMFFTSVVHVDVDKVEACDAFRACRYFVKSPVTRSYLVLGSAVRGLSGMGIDAIAEADGWLCFRIGGGFWAYLVDFKEKYPDLNSLFGFDVISEVRVRSDEVLKVMGLVGNFVEGVEGALLVDIGEGKMKMVGRGGLGECEVVRNVVASEGVSFRVFPELFAEIVKRGEVLLVGSRMIRVEGEGCVYTISLLVKE